MKIEKKDNQLQRVLETGAGRVHKVNGNGLYTFHTTTKYYYDLPATSNEIIVTVKLKFKTGTVKKFEMKI